MFDIMRNQFEQILPFLDPSDIREFSAFIAGYQHGKQAKKAPST